MSDFDPQALCGWVPFELRDREQAELADACVARMSPFQITYSDGYFDSDVRKLLLTDLWKHDRVTKKLGRPFLGWLQWTGSCFPAGTPVRMADGSEKAIEDIRVGDLVITHMGRARRVVDTMSRSYTGDLVSVQVRSLAFPVEMTADHRVAVMPSRCNWSWQPGELEWKRADELQIGDMSLLGYDREGGNGADRVSVSALLGDRAIRLDDLMERREAPVSRKDAAAHQCSKRGVNWKGRAKLVRGRYTSAVLDSIPVGPSLGRLLGLYLAEGTCSEDRVVFSLHAKEESLGAEIVALVRGLFGVGGKLAHSRKRPNNLRVVFSNSTLSATLKAMVPGNTYSKRVPGFLMAADEATRLATLLGWMAGDGHIKDVKRKNKNEISMRGVSASPGLARDMTTLAISCGLKASCCKRKARGRSRVAYDIYLAGRKAVSLCPQLAGALTDGRRLTDTCTSRTQYGYTRAVKKLDRRPVERMTVYDFEVEEDHSFVAGGLTVHNCVGVGGGNALASLNFVEVVRLGQAEELIIPFWPFPYGKSRQRGGMRGSGEGSFGSTFAEACLEDGGPGSHLDGLPKINWAADNVNYDQAVELQWSDGAAAPREMVEEGRKRLVRAVAPVRSAQQAWDAIKNLYPCTCACDKIIDRGMVRIEGGSEKAAVGRRNGRGGHQTSWLGIWDHPELGKLFWEQNQWPRSLYPEDPGGGPRGGCWVTWDSVDWVCRNGEAYAFSQYDYYPSQDVSYIF